VEILDQLIVQGCRRIGVGSTLQVIVCCVRLPARRYPSHR
jgi:hypothetical protein